MGAGAVMGAPQIAWGPLTPPTRTDHPTPTRPTTEETDLRHNIEEADKLPEEDSEAVAVVVPAVLLEVTVGAVAVVEAASVVAAVAVALIETVSYLDEFEVPCETSRDCSPNDIKIFLLFETRASILFCKIPT